MDSNDDKHKGNFGDFPLTTGQIARRLAVPLSKVTQAIDRENISHERMEGTSRLFNKGQFREIARNAIEMCPTLRRRFDQAEAELVAQDERLAELMEGLATVTRGMATQSRAMANMGWARE